MNDRARQALALIGSDGQALAVFVAAYTGVQDPLDALRQTVEPDAAAGATLDERVTRLRRLAFGRTETGEDETAAAAARRELEDIAAAARRDSDAIARAVTAVLEGRAHPPV